MLFCDIFVCVFIQIKLDCPDCFLDVNLFDPDSVDAKIDKMLTNNHKTLTTEQRDAIIENCKLAPNPLLIEFIVNQTLEWKSYTDFRVRDDVAPTFNNGVRNYSKT